MAVSIDTRTLEPGDIYIPVKGANHDGRDFIPEAIRKGARVMDVDLVQYAKKYRKKLKCAVLAVTGSAGKTTTKDMLDAVLSQRYKTVKTQENQNNEIGVPLTILNADADTEILIVEMGMRGRGQIRQLAQIARPTHGVITNVGLSHVEQLGSQKQIAYAKSELFLKPRQWERAGRIAFLNYSTAFYELQVRRAALAGFDVLPFGGVTPVDQNVNLCFVVGRHFGLSDESIRQGILQYKPSAHRMIRHGLGDGIHVLDDTYNANPEAMRYAIQQLGQYSGRKILVMGDMKELGAFSDRAHAAVLDDVVNAGVALVFLVGEATLALKIRYDQADGGWGEDGLWIAHFESHADLIKQLLDEVKHGDTILVKGSRSMRMETVVDALLAARESR